MNYQLRSLAVHPETKVAGDFARYYCLFLAGKIIFNTDIGIGIVPYYASMLVLLLFCVSALLIPKRWLLVHCLMLIFSHPDITQNNAGVLENGLQRSASLWQLSLIGEPTIIWIILLFFVYFCRLKHLAFYSKYLPLIVIFLLIPLVTSVAYGFIGEIGRVISDLKFGVVLLMGLLFFNSPFIRNSCNLSSVVILFLAGCFATISYDAGSLFISFLTRDSYQLANLSMDVAKLFSLFVFYWCLLSLKANTKALLVAPLLVISIILIFEYQTRWLVVTLIVGIFFIRGGMMFRGFLWFIVATLLVMLLYQGGNETIITMINRFNLFGGFDLEVIDTTRFSSISSAAAALNDKGVGGWLFGLGAGAYFIDSPHSFVEFTAAAYDQLSLDQGRYYRLHDFVSHNTFKFGIVGLIAYLLFVKSYLKLWSNRNGIKEEYGVFMVALTCMLPTIVTFPFYTSKGVLLTAYFFAVYRKLRFSS